MMSVKKVFDDTHNRYRNQKCFVLHIYIAGLL